MCVLTSVEKWVKLKTILAKWWDRLTPTSGKEPQKLSHKELLSDRGFLVYVTRTYPAMIPYLNGFHLTIEMWRGGRDAEGWKLPAGDEDSLEELEDEDAARVRHQAKLKQGDAGVYAPKDGLTTPVPRLKDNVAALIRLSNFKLPPMQVVRPSQVVQVFYGFGDASGKQFGATLSENFNCRGWLSGTGSDGSGICFRIGLWLPEEEEESSNYKELRNLVDTIREEAVADQLRDCKLFIFTDHSTAEGCF